MAFSLDDTIAAIATAHGEAGIGIVRISGSQALPLMRRHFHAAEAEWQPRSHQISYGWLLDEEGVRRDEVMAVWFQAPRSYTREDVVEIHSHGSAVAVQQALSLFLNSGARLAESGEMTLRAFLNGRIDLAQAEAVLDVVQARTELSMQAAMAQLAGRLSDEVRQARHALLDVLAHLTATIDFPEDDVPVQNVAPDLQAVAAQLATLLESADHGRLLRDGLRVAIVGRPNVGKSSLLNRLLRHERAIVTDIPGTTRDLVEESLNLRGIPLVLVDTAGIRETSDVVESIGVERSQGALSQADLVLFVVDLAEPRHADEQRLAAQLAQRPVVVVENKVDLVDPQREAEVAALLPARPHHRISALTGAGIPALEAQLWAMVVGGDVAPNEAVRLTNPRHTQAIRAALGHVKAAIRAVEQGLPADFATIDLHAAVAELGEITGERASEQLLDAIFSRFCIGK